MFVRRRVIGSGSVVRVTLGRETPGIGPRACRIVSRLGRLACHSATREVTDRGDWGLRSRDE
jgi:hypothetical protein